MKATPLAKRHHLTLGLSCGASDEEIREAYYRLAFMHHPDRNPEDAYAAARFKEIQIAYEWLSQRRDSQQSPALKKFTIHTPERSDSGLVWQWLAAFAGVVALAVTLLTILRATPRMGTAVKTESSRSQQLPDPSHFAMKDRQQAELSHGRTTSARGSATTISVPDTPEWLAESSEGDLLGPEAGHSHESFSAALDAACTEFFSSERLTEIWQANPNWQATMKGGLPPDRAPITQAVSESSTGGTPEENDQRGVIDGGMIRFGSHSGEPVTLGAAFPEPLPSAEDFDSSDAASAQQWEKRRRPASPSLPEFASSDLGPADRQFEPRHDSSGKWWNGDPQSLLLQQPQPFEHGLLQSYETGNRDRAVHLPTRDRHSFSPGTLSSESSPTYSDYSNPAFLNPLKQPSSTVSHDDWVSSPLLPGQPMVSPSRQEELLPRPLRLREMQQGLHSADHTPFKATADVSSWGANSGHNSWQSGSTAGNRRGNEGSFTQNRIRGIKGDFSVKAKGIATPNLGWSSEPASGASPNYTSLPPRSEAQIEEHNYFSPTASKADASRGRYRDLPVMPSHRYSVPAITPYGSGFGATNTDP